MLRAHNAARREAGQQPLRWNEGLAADALRYASELARTRRFQHSREPRGATPQGENLWMGSTGYFSYAEMVRSWTDEKRYFRRAALPKFSTTGRWSDVGHYTQIIWHSTTDVGCAIAVRSEEHTSELQSLMRISYAVFCLKKKIHNNTHTDSIKSIPMRPN